jgi:hypothetical protein
MGFRLLPSRQRENSICLPQRRSRFPAAAAAKIGLAIAALWRLIGFALILG